MSLNKCYFMGRLTRDPETRPVGQTTVTEFSLAVSRNFKTKEGKKAEEVSFLDFVAWDKGGEVIAEYHKKGDPIIVEAAAKQESWKAQDGSNRNKIVFRVENFVFVPKTNREAKGENEAVATATVPVDSEPAAVVPGDDIPF